MLGARSWACDAGRVILGVGLRRHGRQYAPLISGNSKGRIRHHRRLADHLPEQAPCEPTPRQEPPPELADNRPLPLAFRLPEATPTLTEPLRATRPLTGMPPEPETMPSRISTPILELGSQAPR